jgi:ADP-ribosylglycohydrolase
MVDMLAKYVRTNKPWDALLANANVGGENVHRGSVMGAIFGARASDSNLPSQLKEGLYHYQDIAQEIDDFVGAVLPKDTNDEKKEEL